MRPAHPAHQRAARAWPERFDVGRRLGVGGMGSVWEAFDRERGCAVALKTMNALGPEAVSALKREFRTVRDLAHPNVVTPFELVEHDGEWFFSMELVDGPDVLEWIRGAPAGTSESGVRTVSAARTGTATLQVVPESLAETPLVAPPAPPVWDDRRLRSALRQLSRGLLALHAAGRVHRDVKPSNVRVGPDERLVLLDFGIALPVMESGERRVAGTIEYLSPEQAAGEPVGPAADWYALGVLLFEALVGRPPFVGRPQEVLSAKRARDAVAPSVLAASVPRDLDELCRALLSRDPAARATGYEVIDRVSERRRSRVVSAPRQPRRPFVGRARELQALGRALDDARAHRTVSVLLHGAAGSGKSALVRRFLDAIARPAGALVLEATCHERESVPYRAVDGLVDGLCATVSAWPAERRAASLPRDAALLGEAFPAVAGLLGTTTAGERALDPFERRRRAFRAMREWLRAVARQVAPSPLVVAIENLHWADEDGLALLRDVLRLPGAPPMLLVTTARTEATHIGDLCARLPWEPRLVAVGPLAAQEAEALCAEVLAGADDSVDVAAIVKHAAGNPLAVHEMARHAVAAGGLLPAREAIATRVRALPYEAQDALALAAIAGAPVAVDALASALGLRSEAMDLAIAQLRQSHLARLSRLRGRRSIEPQHDLARDVVREQLSEDSRRELHRRLARALEGIGGVDPEAIAVHRLEAGDGEEARRQALVAAGRADAALAFDRAARLYRLAMHAAPPPDEKARRDAAMRLGNALWNAGRGSEAAAAFVEAAQGAPEPAATDLRRRAAETLLCAGDVDAGTAQLDQVLRGSGLRLPRTRRGAMLSFGARLVANAVRGDAWTPRAPDCVPAGELAAIDAAWTAAVGLGMIDLVRGAHFQSIHLARALAAGEPYRVARALAFEAPIQAARGLRHQARANELCRRAEDAAERAGNVHATALVATSVAFTALQAGSWRAARDAAERAERTLRDRCTGVPWELAMARTTHMWSVAWMGDLDVLARRAPALQHEAVLRGDAFAAVALCVGAIGLAWLAEDDAEGGRAVARDAIARWSHASFFMQHAFFAAAMANADLYAGDAGSALRRVADIWRDLERSQLLWNQLVRVQMREMRARAALAAASMGVPQTPRFVALATAEARRIARERLPWAQPLADLLEAQLAVLRDDRAAADRLLARAASGFDSADMTLHAATARLRRGELLGGYAGAEHAAAAWKWYAAQRVRRPEALARVIAPVRTARPR